MSIIYQIPQTSRFIPTQNTFTATFNSPALGGYSFDVAGNKGQEVLPLQPNSVYLIERLRMSATVDNGDYVSSVVAVPNVILQRSIRNERVYSRPIPVQIYTDGWEVGAWVLSDKAGDKLTMTLEGLLAQVPNTVGVASIKVTVSLSVFEISTAWFNSHFRNQLSESIGQSLRS
jgi:hypothetical protein